MSPVIDNVNHPAHYQTKSGLEVIDIIAALIEDLKGEEAYDVGNAIKYIARYKKKNGVEDLKKAVWYIQRTADINNKALKEEIYQMASNAGIATPPIPPMDYHQNSGGDSNVV